MNAATGDPQTTTVARRQAALIRMLAFALLVGVLAAAGASIFVEVIDGGQELVFTTLPESLGLDSTPWWWAALMLGVGATGVALARRLPGATGSGPLSGFHFDDPLSMVPSVLVAAFFTLVFGLVLGPEAPLIVLGTAFGAILARKADAKQRQAAMLLGGVAAIGAIFGNPFVTAFMILEFAAFGIVPAAIIPAVLVALASGYLTQIGIYGLTGFGLHSMSVAGLPQYDTVEVGDLLLTLVVALLAAGVAVGVRVTASAVDRASGRRPVPVLFAAAAVTAAVLLVAEVGFGVDIALILFSGESGMTELFTQTSTTVMLVVLLGKAIAYAVALGGGFRGGPIFPAMFLGISVAVLVSLVIPGSSVTAMAATGIAASAGTMLKLPATSALLGVLLVGGGGAAVAPLAILGAIIGLAIRMGLDARMSAPDPAATAG